MSSPHVIDLIIRDPELVLWSLEDREEILFIHPLGLCFAHEAAHDPKKGSFMIEAWKTWAGNHLILVYQLSEGFLSSSARGGLDTELWRFSHVAQPVCVF